MIFAATLEGTDVWAQAAVACIEKTRLFRAP